MLDLYVILLFSFPFSPSLLFVLRFQKMKIIFKWRRENKILIEGSFWLQRMPKLTRQRIRFYLAVKQCHPTNNSSTKPKTSHSGGTLSHFRVNQKSSDYVTREMIHLFDWFTLVGFSQVLSNNLEKSRTGKHQSQSQSQSQSKSQTQSQIQSSQQPPKQLQTLLS